MDGSHTTENRVNESLPETVGIREASAGWGPCWIIFITLEQPLLCSWEIPFYLEELEEGRMLCCCCGFCERIATRVLELG